MLYSLYCYTIGSIALQGNSVYLGEVDYSILKALRDSQEPMRYNRLHREASSIFGSRIWIKTFNDHLKKLNEKGEVIRHENNRYNVTYEPARKYTNEEQLVIENEKVFVNAIHRLYQSKPRKVAIVKKFIKVAKFGAVHTFTVLDALLAFAEGNEKRAEKIIDESLCRYRNILAVRLKMLSKFDDIAKIVEEVRKEQQILMDKDFQKMMKKAKQIGGVELRKVSDRKVEIRVDIPNSLR